MRYSKKRIHTSFRKPCPPTLLLFVSKTLFQGHGFSKRQDYRILTFSPEQKYLLKRNSCEQDFSGSYRDVKPISNQSETVIFGTPSRQF